MGYSPDREWTDGGDIVLKSCLEEKFSVKEIAELLKRSEASVEGRIQHLVETGAISAEMVEELELDRSA